MLESLRARVAAANALELARAAVPKSQLYPGEGRVGGMPVTLHGEGDLVYHLSKDGQRAEVDFEPRQPATMPAPTSAATPPASVPMPMPVAPAGEVRSGWTGE